MKAVRIMVGWFFLSGCILLPDLVPVAQADSVQTYIFKVFLEDEEIGKQRFEVSSNGTRTKIEIDARFDVTYWFYTAYSYHHTNTEIWKDECLHMIRSQTNDNGETFFVRGTYANNRLRLVTHSGSRSVDGCVKTFAYWDPHFLSSTSLLNSQTGELNHVTVKDLGQDVISVRNQPTPANHYKVVAEKFAIDLWYSQCEEWVALQSTTEGESRLRYVLQ